MDFRQPLRGSNNLRRLPSHPSVTSLSQWKRLWLKTTKRSPGPNKTASTVGHGARSQRPIERLATPRFISSALNRARWSNAVLNLIPSVSSNRLERSLPRDRKTEYDQDQFPILCSQMPCRGHPQGSVSCGFNSKEQLSDSLPEDFCDCPKRGVERA